MDERYHRIDSHVLSMDTVVPQWDLPGINLPTTTVQWSHDLVRWLILINTFTYYGLIAPWLMVSGANNVLPIS